MSVINLPCQLTVKKLKYIANHRGSWSSIPRPSDRTVQKLSCSNSNLSKSRAKWTHECQSSPNRSNARLQLREGNSTQKVPSRVVGCLEPAEVRRRHSKLSMSWLLPNESAKPGGGDPRRSWECVMLVWGNCVNRRFNRMFSVRSSSYEVLLSVALHRKVRSMRRAIHRTKNSLTSSQRP